MIAAIFVLFDTLIGTVGADQLPLPLSRYLLPAALVAGMVFVGVARRPLDAWLVVLLSAAAFTEVNENNLALQNVDLFQSFFNNRGWPIPISPFDILVAIASLLSLPALLHNVRKLLRSPLVVVGVCLAAWFFLMALRALATHHSLYETARDLRPPLLIGALPVLAGPFISTADGVRLGRLLVATALLKAAEGLVRLVLGIGVPHLGVHLTFYDVTNDLVLMTGASLVLITMTARRRLLRWAFAAMLAVPFVFSLRRGAFLGGSSALLLNVLWHRPSTRLFLAAAAAILIVIAAESDTLLGPLQASKAYRSTTPSATASPSGTPTPTGVTIVNPIATDRPAGQPYEVGDVEASNKFRLLDAKNAVLNVLHHPIFGIGLATDYTIYDDGGQPNSPFLLYAVRTSHVGYLAVALKAGLIGLGMFLALLFLAGAKTLGRPYPERLILASVLCAWVVVNFTSPLAESVRAATLLGLLLARLSTATPSNPPRP